MTSDPRFGGVGHYDEATGWRSSLSGETPNGWASVIPLDCLLWRAAREGEPSWESALGRGRPGWHIECVTIALDHLGMSFDVQGGGNDLIFPHHEMAHHKRRCSPDEWPYARHYAHTAMVALDGEDEQVTRETSCSSQLIADGVDEMAIRLALLDNHYRVDWGGLKTGWTRHNPARSANGFERWRAAVSPLRGGLPPTQPCSRCGRLSPMTSTAQPH